MKAIRIASLSLVAACLAFCLSARSVVEIPSTKRWKERRSI